MDELKTIAEKALRYGEKLGAEEVEVCLVKGITREVKCEGEEVQASSKMIEEASVRTSIGTKVGISYVTDFNERSVLRAVEDAFKMARASQGDPYWRGLPDPSRPGHRWIGYDEGLVTLETSDMISMMNELKRWIKGRGKELKIARAAINTSILYELIVNTRGVWAEDRGTGMYAFIYLKGKRGDRESTGFGYRAARSMINDFEPMINDAIRLAKDGLRAEPLEGGKYSGRVVLTQEVFASLIQSLLIPAIAADNVQEGLSPLKGKVGERILADTFTMIDDGTKPGGIGTTLYDGEGVARGKTTIFERGVLKSFIHNTYTARRENRNSTGNASRRAGRVGVAPSNLIINRGTKSKEELIGELEEGILLDGMLMSVHTVNPVTGDFSVVVTNPYLIERGEVTKPLKQLTFAGNIYQSLKDYLAANDCKWASGSIFTPTVMIGEATLSS